MVAAKGKRMRDTVEEKLKQQADGPGSVLLSEASDEELARELLRRATKGVTSVTRPGPGRVKPIPT